MTHHILRRGAGVPDHKIMHPERDWVIGLTIATLVFISGAVYSGNKFTEYLSLLDEEVAADSTVVQYKQTAISEVLGKYGERTKKFEELRSDKVIVVAEGKESDDGDKEGEEVADNSSGGLEDEASNEEAAQSDGEDDGLTLE